MVNEINFFIQCQLIRKHVALFMGLVEIAGLVNVPTNLIVTFVPPVKKWRAIQKVN